MAAWLIARRKVNTLVVVHRQQLLDQWQERLGMFLDLPAKSIGHIGGGKSRPDKQRISLPELPLPSPLPKGAEWIVAYRYWRTGKIG